MALTRFEKSENMKIHGMLKAKRSVVYNLQFAICNLQFAVISFFLFSATLPSQAIYADAPVAAPVEGRPFSGELTSIDTKGQIVFQAAAEKRQLPLGDLVAWGACPEPNSAPILVMTDGGLLAGDVLSSDKEILVADSELFGRLENPLGPVGRLVLVAAGLERSRRPFRSDRPGGSGCGSSFAR